MKNNNKKKPSQEFRESWLLSREACAVRRMQLMRVIIQQRIK